MSEQLDKYLRKALKKVIDDIQKEIPDTDANKMFIALLNTERRGIPYKAPEILSNLIQKIYDILILYAPLENDAKNPQWKKNISDIWNAFGQDLRDKSADDNAAPN